MDLNKHRLELNPEFIFCFNWTICKFDYFFSPFQKIPKWYSTFADCPIKSPDNSFQTWSLNSLQQIISNYLMFYHTFLGG